MDCSFGKSFVTTAGLRIYILKWYLTLGRMYVYVKERSPNEPDIWLQDVRRTQQNLSLQPRSLCHSIFWLFSRLRTPSIFLVDSYFCRQGTVAMEVWISYPSYSCSLWTVFKSNHSLLLTRTLCLGACLLILYIIHFWEINPVNLALIGVLAGRSGNGLQKCACD